MTKVFKKNITRVSRAVEGEGVNVKFKNVHLLLELENLPESKTCMFTNVCIVLFSFALVV